MSMYSNRLQPALQNLVQCLPLEIVMHDDAYIGGRSENNLNASDSAASLALRVILSVS